MTGTFRANNPFNTFMLLIYGLLLKLEWFISPQVPVIQKSDGFLYNRILANLKPVLDGYPVIYSIITYFLLYTQAISFNRLLNNRRLMQKPNYLPGNELPAHYFFFCRMEYIKCSAGDKYFTDLGLGKNEQPVQ